MIGEQHGVYALTLPYVRALKNGTLEAAADTWRERGERRSEGKVAIIPVMGVITQRSFYYGTSIESIRSSLRYAIGSDSYSAIVLDVHSPGGEVYGIQELANEIRAARQKKPIVAVANALAASAAYWIASAATFLCVTPSGEVGSIGVYGTHQDWSRALDQLGVTVTLVSAGEGKTDGNMFEPLSDEARADMKRSVNRCYRQFVEGVAANRSVSPAKVEKYWRAKLYGAEEAAYELGMADGVGTIDDAIGEAFRLGRQQQRAREANASRVDADAKRIRRNRGI